ncbi:unnamed protein product [Adineta ricciae]|uniref:LicD/FKTN/FKRP nucleotidyltransferase domain-containing protein n=1 Tax=Adineta ricciae TaxID=249248 RepID=A0A814Y1M6_ADIRI|nr:unnamed protein product [Adineta ricciae]
MQGTIRHALIFIYNFYEYKNSADFTPTTNYSSETFLPNLTACESGDTDRQRFLLELFHGWTQFAHENNIPYCIFYGTLVGYVQHGNLISYDGDVDVLMLQSDTVRLVPFADTNFSATYHLKLQPQWSTVGYTNRSYFYDQGINFIAPNARFKRRGNSGFVDIYPGNTYHPDDPQNSTYRGKTLTIYDRSYYWLPLPIEWIFPLKPCLLTGIKTWCPAKPDKIVARIYGSESVNHSNYECINNTWVKALF